MALQIARPAPAAGRQSVQYPSKVTVGAQALFQMLSHSLRRQHDQPTVIGTLVGVRNDDSSEVQVRAAYVVPIIPTTEDEGKIDNDYHREMYQLIRRVHPDSVILGWYSTSPELNNLSAVIHEFYSQETGSYPYPAVHLTLETSNPSEFKVRTYVSSPVGVPSELGNFGNCIFLPVANSVSYNPADKAAYSVVAKAAEDEDRIGPVMPPEVSLDNAFFDVLSQLDRVLEFVRAARKMDKVTPEVEAVGRYLYRTLSTVPVLSSPGAADAMYKKEMRELLAVVTMTKSLRSQLQVTSELTTLI